MTPCEMGLQCKNSPDVVGEGNGKCYMCRLSPARWEVCEPDKHYWKPIDKKAKHPVLESEKRTEARQRVLARQVARLAKDKNRQKVMRRAQKAEADTQKKFIQATRNSGRVNQDGDHVVVGRVTLDTKLQSDRVHPIVDMGELVKVRMQAAASGQIAGGLVLRTKNNVGVVAMFEDDFARLIRLLPREEGNVSD